MINKIPNVIMVDPMAVNGAAADVDKATGLMKDTVHMKKEGYTRLAAACKETIADWLRSRKRKSVESKNTGGEGAKRPRKESDPENGRTAGPYKPRRGGFRKYY